MVYSQSVHLMASTSAVYMIITLVLHYVIYSSLIGITRCSWDGYFRLEQVLRALDLLRLYYSFGIPHIKLAKSMHPNLLASHAVLVLLIVCHVLRTSD